MRPVGSPEDALRIRGNQSLGKGCDIGIRRRFLGNAIRSRNFDVRLARADELYQYIKTRLGNSQGSTRTCEMVENDGQRGGDDILLKRCDNRKF